MLKIYLCTLHYDLQTSKETEYLGSHSSYVIKDESTVANKTKEFSVYSEEASEVYYKQYTIKQKRRGKVVKCYVNYDSAYCLKEWKEPDAKLVARLTYEEQSCSMKHLMTLPATDVIAYLKQEGLKIS